MRPSILAAINEWAESRMSEVTFVWKGTNCLTEMYSALRADVPDESDDRTLLNEGLLRALRESSSVIVCGQALSHCVNFTVRDLVEHVRSSSVTILVDATSAVPGFEETGRAFLEDMKRNGVRLATTETCF